MDSSEAPKRREDVLRESSKGLDIRVYGLKDDAAIVVDDGEPYLIGSAPYIVEPE